MKRIIRHQLWEEIVQYENENWFIFIPNEFISPFYTNITFLI